MYFEMGVMCPLDGCEEKGYCYEVDGQLHVMYCLTCRSYFQIPDFSAFYWDSADEEDPKLGMK